MAKNSANSKNGPAAAAKKAVTRKAEANPPKRVKVTSADQKSFAKLMNLAFSETSERWEIHLPKDICVRVLEVDNRTKGTRIQLRVTKAAVDAGFKFIQPTDFTIADWNQVTVNDSKIMRLEILNRTTGQRRKPDATNWPVPTTNGPPPEEF